jgi:3-phosphoshikimate 1-carboxyvinyltransferase
MIVPGDKSITHRALILSSLLERKVTIYNALYSEDCQRTAAALRAMGVSITEPLDTQGDSLISKLERKLFGEGAGGVTLTVEGKGLHGLTEPEDTIDCGNSGTTIRLLTGLLSGYYFFSTLTGDASLRRRPMRRVADPLHAMGARIWGRFSDTAAPLAIKGGGLLAINYTLPIASAQVKSALLFAGLNAKGTTVITDPYGTRDHTERILQHLGASFTSEETLEGVVCSIEGGVPFEYQGGHLLVPGDFSAAAFFIVATLIVPDSKIMIRNVGVNFTRTGLLDVLEKMGAKIEIAPKRGEDYYEPVADITVFFSELKGAGIVEGEIIPRMIDEFPILCIAAAAADGETIIRGAKELRVKESDRITAMVKALSVIGVVAEELPDGIKIFGKKDWRTRKERDGGACDTKNDHRVAMAMKIAQLCTEGEITLSDETCIDTSFPGFEKTLQSLKQ